LSYGAPGQFDDHEENKRLLAAVDHVHDNHIDVPKQYKMFAFIKKEELISQRRKSALGLLTMTTDK